MTPLETVIQLRNQLESAKDNKVRAEGKLEAALTTLKAEFKCKSIKDGMALLEEMKTEQATRKKILQKAIEQFEGKWSDKLVF